MAVTFSEIFDAGRRLWARMRYLMLGRGRQRRSSSLPAELANGTTDLREVLSRLSTSHDDDYQDEKTGLNTRLRALSPIRSGRPSLQFSEPRHSRESRRRADLSSLNTRLLHTHDQNNNSPVHYTVSINGEAAHRQRSSATSGTRPRKDSGGGAHNQAISWAARPSIDRHGDFHNMRQHHSQPGQARQRSLREPDLERGALQGQR